MIAGLRKLVLTAHIVSSVGWLGAVLAVLALAVAGAASADEELVRATYLAMEVVTWFVLVPLAFATLVTGVVQSLVTKWGLVRHYWVIAKLMLTVFATIILLLYTQTIAYLADQARTNAPTAIGDELSPVLHSGAALLLLVTATILAVYKPRGVTRYGLRRQEERPRPESP